MVQRVTGGKALPAEVVQQIVAKTDGVPLFVEELTKTVLESGLLQEHEDALRADAAPASAGDSRHAAGRAAWRGWIGWPRARRWRNWGRCWGGRLPTSCCGPWRPWTSWRCGAAWRSWCRPRCSTSGACRRRPPILFKHALIQDAAYQSLLRSTRQQYHQRIAQVLAAQFPETGRDTARAAGAALHRGGAPEPGHTLLAAGRRNAPLSARPMRKRSATSPRGLEVLTLAPGHARACPARTGLATRPGRVAAVTRGYAAPDVEHGLTRARALCQQVGDAAQHLPGAVWPLGLLFSTGGLPGCP